MSKNKNVLPVHWKYCAPTGLAVALMLNGCATTVSPDSLREPSEIRCIYLPQKVSYASIQGLNYHWDHHLEKGAYFADREDDTGYYFRGPPGAFTAQPTDGVFTFMANHNGGIWLPKDPNEHLRFYYYQSVNATPYIPPSDNEDCSSYHEIHVQVDQTSHIAVAFGSAGAIGGVAGRAMVPGSKISYGAAGIGGAVGMGIVGAVIQSGEGQIVLVPEYDSPEYLQFIATLNAYASKAVVLQPLSGAASAATGGKSGVSAQ